MQELSIRCQKVQRSFKFIYAKSIYGVDISPSLISTVTDSVLDEVRAWQSRALETVYPILYLDALKIKVKSQGRVVNKLIYLAFGVTLNGLKEVLGIWAVRKAQSSGCSSSPN